MLRSVQALCLVALSALLAACGGSSGSSDDVAGASHEPCPTEAVCDDPGDELCGRVYNSVALNPRTFNLSTNQVIFRGESDGACSEPHPDAGRNSVFNYGSFPYTIMGNGLGLDVDGATELLGAYKDDGSVVSLGVKAPGQTEPGLTLMLEKASELEIHDLLNSTYYCTGVLFTGIGDLLELSDELPPGFDASNIITDWLVSGQLKFGPSNRDVEVTITGKTLNAAGQIENEEFFSVAPESGDVLRVSEDGYFRFPLANELTGAEGFVDQSLNKLVVRSDGLTPLARFMMFCQKEGVESPVPSGVFLKTFYRRKAVPVAGSLLLEYVYSAGVSEVNFTAANTLSRRDLNVTDNDFVADVTSFFDQQYKWFDSDGSGFIDEDLDTEILGNDIILRNESATYLRMNDASNEIIERRIPEVENGKRPSQYEFIYEIGIGLGI